jgi:hypothetical protein
VIIANQTSWGFSGTIGDFLNFVFLKIVLQHEPTTTPDVTAKFTICYEPPGVL